MRGKGLEEESERARARAREEGEKDREMLSNDIVTAEKSVQDGNRVEEERGWKRAHVRRRQEKEREGGGRERERERERWRRRSSREEGRQFVRCVLAGRKRARRQAASRGDRPKMRATPAAGQRVTRGQGRAWEEPTRAGKGEGVSEWSTAGGQQAEAARVLSSAEPRARRAYTPRRATRPNQRMLHLGRLVRSLPRCAPSRCSRIIRTTV